jgi:hypothetical protein
VSIEHRVDDARAGGEGPEAGLAAGEFEDRKDGLVGADGGKIAGLSLFDDGDNAALLVEEKHVEGDEGVFHPHADADEGREVEQHASTWG